MKLPEIPDLFSVFQNWTNKAPEGAKRSAANTNLTVNVTMMGGRRCGKTSVLAAMEDCFQRKIYKNTNITCYSDDDVTLQTLRDKKAEIDAYFIDRKRYYFQPDSTPTSEVAQYSFCIGLRGTGTKRTKESGHINLVFHDYPGEWLDNHQDDVAEIVEKSQVIIIAIDTPYMMEEDGKYNRKRNNYDLIWNVLNKSHFAEEDETDGKMVLFVPIKCEKYRNPVGRRGQSMRDVNAAIKKSYEPLIDCIRNSSKYFAAITPVYTLGEAVFSEFEKDAHENIIEEAGVARQANYVFTDNARKEPSPQFCEQPLFYILAYTLAMAKKSKERGGIFAGVLNAFQEAILHWPSADEYLMEYENIHTKICETMFSIDGTQSGYEVIKNCDWLKIDPATMILQK